MKPVNFFALDFERDYDTEHERPILVLTFTPRKDRFQHFHIELIADKDLKEFYDFLGDFLNATTK